MRLLNTLVTLFHSSQIRTLNIRAVHHNSFHLFGGVFALEISHEFFHQIGLS